MGLLSKTLSVADSIKNKDDSTAEKLSFEDFFQKYDLCCCAIFSPFENNYVITHSVGFDAVSLISSISTKDFWNGTVKSNNWETFSSNEELLPFFQLFSFNQKDKINKIFIKRFNDKIFMICSTNESKFIANDKITNDLELIYFETEKVECENDDFSIALSKNQNVYKFSLNAQNAIEAIIKKNLSKLEYESVIKDAIKKEIYYFLKKSFSQNAIIFQHDDVYNIALISEGEVFENVLKIHLMGELEYFFDTEVNALIFTSHGKANSYKNLIDFLKS